MLNMTIAYSIKCYTSHMFDQSIVTRQQQNEKNYNDIMIVLFPGSESLAAGSWSFAHGFWSLAPGSLSLGSGPRQQQPAASSTSTKEQHQLPAASGCQALHFDVHSDVHMHETRTICTHMINNVTISVKHSNHFALSKACQSPRNNSRSHCRCNDLFPPRC